MPTFSTTNHALQFGNNPPTVTLVGSDTDGYIIYDMSTSGTFYQFAPNTKYFAIEIIFDTPFNLTPGIVLSPANNNTAGAVTASPGVEFFVDQIDVTTTYFKISGISSSTALFGPEVLMWAYQVGGTQLGGPGTVTNITAAAPLTGGTITTSGTIGIPKASASQDGYLAQGDWTTFNNKLATAVTNVSTTSRLTGGPITTTGTLDLATSGVSAGTKNGLTFDAYGRITATPTGHLTADGYTIDISGGASNNQVLQYNGTSFIPGTLTSGVSSVSNSDSTLTIAPTTGAVVASLNLAHTNTWSAKQTFSSHIAVDGYTIDLSGGATTNQSLRYNGTSFIPSDIPSSYVTNSMLVNSSISFTSSDSSITLDVSAALGGTEHIALNLAHSNIWTAEQDISISSVGTGTTLAGSIKNTTAAALGAQQYSPVLELQGQGWETNTSASQIVDFGLQTRPVQGAANPTGALHILKNINGGGYSTIANIDSTGTITATHHIIFDGYTLDLSAGATTNQVLQYNGTSFVAATVSTSSTLQQAYTAGSAGTWQTITESSANGGVQILAGTNSGALFNIGGVVIPMLNVASTGALTVYGQISSALDNNGNIGASGTRFGSSYAYNYISLMSGSSITGANQQIDIVWGTNGNVKKVTLTGNVTSWFVNRNTSVINTAHNDSATVTLIFAQSGGPWTLAAPIANGTTGETVTFAGGSFSLTNASGAVDSVTLTFDPVSNTWREISRSLQSSPGGATLSGIYATGTTAANQTMTLSSSNGGPPTLLLGGVGQSNPSNSSTAGYGLFLQNTTAATVSVNQYSPAIVLEGYGWDANTTAGSYSQRWFIQNQPFEGTLWGGFALTFGAQGNHAGISDTYRTEIVFLNDRSGSLTSTPRIFSGGASDNFYIGVPTVSWPTSAPSINYGMQYSASGVNVWINNTAGYQFDTAKFAGSDNTYQLGGQLARWKGLYNSAVLSCGRNLQSGTSYIVVAGDAYIGMSNTAGRTVTLIAASSTFSGQIIIIKDEAGTAGGPGQNITINRSSADTIDGATSYVISINYSSVRLISNGSNAWFTF